MADPADPGHSCHCSGRADHVATPGQARRHLLSVSDLGRQGIEELLSISDAFVEVQQRAIPKVPALRGKTVATLFAEDSTRTRLSFETAARRLSADVLTYGISGSSASKGESLRDTLETLAAMGVDAFVIRHPSAGVPLQASRWVDASIVNAGDGAHEHPTQALLDCATLRQVLAERAGESTAEHGVAGFEGLRVTIVGDVRHSRVARSLVMALHALGARVTLVAPSSLLPVSLDSWPVTASHDLDEALPSSDVCYVLRLQAERGSSARVPSKAEYVARYGLSARRVARMGPDGLVMHPGPMVRGLEISSEVAAMDRCLVRRQVANGVTTRMAVLFWLLASGPSPSTVASHASALLAGDLDSFTPRDLEAASVERADAGGTGDEVMEPVGG